LSGVFCALDLLGLMAQCFQPDAEFLPASFRIGVVTMKEAGAGFAAQAEVFLDGGQSRVRQRATLSRLR